MIETITYSGDGWKVLKEFEGWKIGYLRYCDRFSELTEMECHLKTDEVFVLLEGEAVLYTETEAIAMERGILYNIPKGEWHHIVVSRDTTVLVIENSNTSKGNTKKRYLDVGKQEEHDVNE